MYPLKCSLIAKGFHLCESETGETLHGAKETDHSKMPIADRMPRIADNNKKIADKMPIIADNNKKIADKMLRIADNIKKIADKMPRIADNNIRIADKNSKNPRKHHE